MRELFIVRSGPEDPIGGVDPGLLESPEIDQLVTTAVTRISGSLAPSAALVIGSAPARAATETASLLTQGLRALDHRILGTPPTILPELGNDSPIMKTPSESRGALLTRHIHQLRQKYADQYPDLSGVILVVGGPVMESIPIQMRSDTRKYQEVPKNTGQLVVNRCGY